MHKRRSAQSHELSRQLKEAAELRVHLEAIERFAQTSELRWETAVEAVNYVRLAARASNPVAVMPVRAAIEHAQIEMQKAHAGEPSVFSSPLH